MALTAKPAGASAPIGGCPPAFEGPFTFAQIIDRWPPPPDLEDPEALLAFYDINDDLLLCVQPHPRDETRPNFIDNFVRIR